MDDSGNVCRPGKMQLEQGFLRLFLSEMMPVHDWEDGIGHFGVAEYLAELIEVHLVGLLYTQSWMLGGYLFGPFARAGV